MILTVRDDIQVLDSRTFNDSKEAIKFMKQFKNIVTEVNVAGQQGLAVVYYILNSTINNEDYVPPNINNTDPNISQKVDDVTSQITKVMGKRYSRR